jgi:transmembrane sensor
MMQLREISRTRGMSPVEAAAHWVVRRDARELTAAEEAEFTSWQADPVNAEAYGRADGAMALFDLDHGADPNLKALRQAALEVAPAPRRSFRMVGSALLAASLVGVIVLFGIERPNDRTQPANPAAIVVAQAPGNVPVQAEQGEYVTGVGERRAIKLADGSSVTLNTRTKITVAYTAGRRLIRLVRGQALFEVAHNRNRPFVVEAADRQVTALGTTFEVRVDPGRVNVVLIKGRVVVDRTRDATNSFDGPPVAPAFLKPGEEFSAELGAPQRVVPVNVERQLLWRDGFVEFDDEPLGLAVAEINRYANRPITLRDDGVGALHLSGVFRTGSPDGFIDAIGAVLPVAARPTAQGGIELSLARAPRH